MLPLGCENDLLLKCTLEFVVFHKESVSCVVSHII